MIEIMKPINFEGVQSGSNILKCMLVDSFLRILSVDLSSIDIEHSQPEGCLDIEGAFNKIPSF